MPVLIPFAPSIPSQRFGTSLDGVQYVIDATWNERDDAWFFDLYDQDGITLLRAGIKIVLGSLLGRRSVDPAFPPGVMVATDTLNRDQEAGLDTLGTTVKVVYYTLEEAVDL